jgi:hypothetical protein
MWGESEGFLRKRSRARRVHFRMLAWQEEQSTARPLSHARVAGGAEHGASGGAEHGASTFACSRGRSFSWTFAASSRRGRSAWRAKSPTRARPPPCPVPMTRPVTPPPPSFAQSYLSLPAALTPKPAMQ